MGSAFLGGFAVQRDGRRARACERLAGELEEWSRRRDARSGPPATDPAERRKGHDAHESRIRLRDEVQVDPDGGFSTDEGVRTREIRPLDRGAIDVEVGDDGKAGGEGRPVAEVVDVSDLDRSDDRGMLCKPISRNPVPFNLSPVAPWFMTRMMAVSSPSIANSWSSRSVTTKSSEGKGSAELGTQPLASPMASQSVGAGISSAFVPEAKSASTIRLEPRILRDWNMTGASSVVLAAPERAF